MGNFMATEQLIINGERVNASDNGTFDVFDPSSGETLATVAKATKADVDRAVQSAQAALESKAWVARHRPTAGAS
jgi:acyl-CoA reductase-like NAD-dependent aldehyde dehydrogenase